MGLKTFPCERKVVHGSDFCIAIKTISQRARGEANIESKGIHSPRTDARHTLGKKDIDYF